VALLLLLRAAAWRSAVSSVRFVASPKFIAGLLVALLAGGVYAMQGKAALAALDAFWGLFARSQQPVTAVLPNDLLWLPVTGQEVPVTDKVGTGDALALGLLQYAVWERGQSRVEVLTSEQIRDTIARGGSLPAGPLVLIGGPVASEITLQSMARLRSVDDPNDPQGLKRGFRFELKPAGRATAFSRPASGGQAPELGIRDVQSEELCRVKQATDNTFAPDAALVMLGNLDGRPVLIVAGYETRGTAAAMQFLIRPSPELTSFYRIYRDQDYAEMVIRTQPGTGEPELFPFDTAENPRGKGEDGD